MDAMIRMGGRWAREMGIVAACFLMGGCADFEESGLPGSASSMARNQMMLVRRDPPSFGYYRLTSLARIHPDLAFFMEKQGTPDFLAETDAHSRDYFILYYLKERHAFACRSRPGKQESMEFAGPYPVTNKEFKILDGFRKDKGR
jgi:hypothetical protein